MTLGLAAADYKSFTDAKIYFKEAKRGFEQATGGKDDENTLHLTYLISQVRSREERSDEMGIR